MSDVKQLTTRGHVSWVNADTWPDEGGCHIVALTDRQVSIIRQMVWPRALEDNVILVPVWPGTYNEPSGDIVVLFRDEVEALLDKLGSEDMADCADILDALSDIRRNTGRYTPWHYSYINTNLAAGTTVNNMYTVPSSGVGMRLDQIMFSQVGTATSVRFHIVRGATWSALSYTLSPVSASYYVAKGPFYLQADDVLQVRTVGSTAGDDITVWLHGVSWEVPVIT